jgi:hypothetical protein
MSRATAPLEDCDAIVSFEGMFGTARLSVRGMTACRALTLGPCKNLTPLCAKLKR